jgi:hypothetical protein
MKMKMRTIQMDLFYLMWIFQSVVVDCLLPSSEADISYHTRERELTYILFLSLHPNDQEDRSLDNHRQIEQVGMTE